MSRARVKGNPLYKRGEKLSSLKHIETFFEPLQAGLDITLAALNVYAKEEQFKALES